MTSTPPPRSSTKKSRDAAVGKMLSAKSLIRPSLPCGSNADPLWIRILTRTFGADGSLHISTLRPLRSFSSRGVELGDLCPYMAIEEQAKHKTNRPNLRNKLR